MGKPKLDLTDDIFDRLFRNSEANGVSVSDLISQLLDDKFGGRWVNGDDGVSMDAIFQQLEQFDHLFKED